MAKVVGIFTFIGRVGNMVHYMLNGVHRSRTIGKIDLHKMRTAPQYEETRKNQSDFAVATKAGQLFRQGLMHITKGYTNYNYPVAVMKIMLKTLQTDTTQPKGSKQISKALKSEAAQNDFSRLKIFSKRDHDFYHNTLVKRTPDQKAWRLNRNLLYGKGVDGDQMTVKIGYYHVDFDARIAKYEDVLSIACHRNEKIDYSDFSLPKPNTISTPWTFVIMQVWREGSIQDITGMTFLSVLDVVENNVEVTKQEETRMMYKCGLEIEDVSKKQRENKAAKMGLKIKESNLPDLAHGYNAHRDALVKFNTHDWDEVIEKVVEDIKDS
jgi:hypothetical protein